MARPTKLTATLILLAAVVFAVPGASQAFWPSGDARDAAIRHVEQGAQAARVPTGFGKARWLMSAAQVGSLYPQATASPMGGLRLETTAFNRSVVVTFKFSSKGSLVQTIVQFKGILLMNKEERVSLYRKTQAVLEARHGPLTAPRPRAMHALESYREVQLSSQIPLGGVRVSHVLYEPKTFDPATPGGLPYEQVIAHRTQ